MNNSTEYNISSFRKAYNFLLSLNSHTLKETLSETLLLVPAVVASGIIIAFLSPEIITPQWIANGWPSFSGYPKNIEQKALQFIVLSTALISFLFYRVKSKRIKLSIMLLLSLAAFVVVFPKLSIGQPLMWVKHIFTLLALLSAFYYAVNYYVEDTTGHPVRLSTHISAVIIGVLWISYFFYLIMHFEKRAALIDVHHQGEVFTSAVDFIRGGKPFITYFWPHGLMDTGITALAFKITSRMDVPTLILGNFFFLSLGIPTFLFLAYGMRLGYVSLIMLLVVLCTNAIVVEFLPNFFFVALAFLIFSRATKRYHFVLSGIVMFIAHIYRIEAGIYGFMAVLVVGIYQIAAAAFMNSALLKEKTINFCLFVSGVFITALLMYMVFGWPSHEWYHTVFSILPRYHTDSTGFPFPLPLTGSLNYYFQEFQKTRHAVFYVITVLGMFAIACTYLYKNFRKAAADDTFFLLIILLSVICLKTAFGRSDMAHINWASYVAYLTLGLFLARSIVHSSLSKIWMKIALISVIFAFFNFSSGLFNNRPWAYAEETLKEGNMRFFKDYSQMPAQCANGLFSNLILKANPYFDREVCITRSILEVSKIGRKQLLLSHSAALLYPSLGYELPTKYYCLGWAITDEMQRDLISDLEKSDVTAVLFANKYRALNPYDIPDHIRLPVYFKWFQETFDISKPVLTPLGILVFRKDYNIMSAKPLPPPTGIR